MMSQEELDRQYQAIIAKYPMLLTYLKVFATYPYLNVQQKIERLKV